jgi:hypothetical protein
MEQNHRIPEEEKDQLHLESYGDGATSNSSQLWMMKVVMTKMMINNISHLIKRN